MSPPPPLFYAYLPSPTNGDSPEIMAPNSVEQSKGKIADGEILGTEGGQHKNHYHKNHGGPGNVDLKADLRVAEDAVCQGSGSDIGCCSRPRCLQ